MKRLNPFKSLADTSNMKSILSAALMMAFLMVSLFPVDGEARRRRLPVDEPLKTELNTLLKMADELHSALFIRDEGKAQTTMDSMLGHIVTMEEKLKTVTETKAAHLAQVVRSIRNHLKLIQEYKGERRIQTLRSVFSNVVQIATNYHLDRYRIFFCSKDRAVWLQKAWKARHPFHHDTASLRHCGSAIR